MRRSEDLVQRRACPDCGLCETRRQQTTLQRILVGPEGSCLVYLSRTCPPSIPCAESWVCTDLPVERFNRLSKERGLELLMPAKGLVHKGLKFRFVAKTLQQRITSK